MGVDLRQSKLILKNYNKKRSDDAQQTQSTFLHKERQYIDSGVIRMNYRLIIIFATHARISSARKSSNFHACQRNRLEGNSLSLSVYQSLSQTIK